ACEKLRRCVAEYHPNHRGERFETTASLGAMFVMPGHEAHECITIADTALLAAKDTGKNRVTIQRPDDPTSMLGEASRWGTNIKQALNEDRLETHFQPIVDFSAQSIGFHEVLVRLRSTEGHLVGPDIFLPAAERFGLMLEIDHYVLTEAFDRLKDDEDLALFVNISGSSLGEKRLGNLIRRQIEQDGSVARRLVVEITETAGIRDFALASTWMEDLKALGVRFALDDFGVGYASFTCLRSLPVDFVKIDGEIIRRLQNNEADRAWVKAMIAVGQALGKRIVAEFIEDRQTAEEVREMGVEFGQGHYWASPQSDPMRQIPSA
ncbi:MAG: GGDEF domain-containing phosphodiesterase, partial [Phycisphaeraceae bacterium]|nr:GGDEF domain-containing phosphodiesterase [Phycisphaeraceae bacterium]